MRNRVSTATPGRGRRWDALLLALALVVLALAAVLPLRTMYRLGDTVAAVSHTQDVLQEVNHLWGVLGDRDTQMLRYLLTGRADNLAQFREHEHDFEAAVARLQTLIADDPAQRRLLGEFIDKHLERRRRSDWLIATKQRAEAGDAEAIETLRREFELSPGRGMAMAMRLVLDRMAAHERGQLAAQLDARASAVDQTRLLVGAALLGALLATVAALLSFRRLRRRADEALRASVAAAEARRAARQRQAGLDLISHDLRQHLGNIQFSLDLLRGATDPAARVELIDTATSATNSGLLFLEAMLEQAAGDARGEGAVDLVLAEAVEAVVGEQAAHAASKQMRLALRLDRSLVAHVQPAAFAHVLGNLLSNALKYAPPGSEVEIELERSGSAGERAILRVLDRGPGVAEADQPRLFRRFQPLSAAPTGGETATGLGLALARQHARAMGGELRYAAREGGGAVFSLELLLMPGER